MSPYQSSITCFVVIAFLFALVLHRALRRNGQVFVDELFANHPAAGRALVRLLDIGYVLFNVGYMAAAGAFFSPGSDGHDGARAVAAAIGWQMLLLAMGHGVNIWLFSRKVGRAMRQNAEEIEALLRS